jgi:serine/threonine-protein kinase
MKICPACGNQYPDDANFCPMDASKLPSPIPAGAPVPVATDPDSAPPPTAAAAPTTVMDAPQPLNGRFMVGDQRARTVTGTVYDASDATDASSVQVKVVDAKTLPTAMMADRALRELKQLTKVKSDKILRVIDQGKDREGRVFVATERMTGTTLEELVERDGALPFERARAIVMAVGEALTEAQKVGVIHRDVAPRNIVVDGDKIKVTDFGLAEPVSDKVYGTPAFLSPEQAEGKPVDQRSNIYSLGALFYYMLAGAPPFSGDRDALVQQHLHAQPQPPSARRPGISPEIDKLVLKALEKSGGRRHLTLRQLLNEVTALQSPSAMGSAEPPAREERAAAKTIMDFGGSRANEPDLTERMGRVTDPGTMTAPSLSPPVSRNEAVTVANLPVGEPTPPAVVAAPVATPPVAAAPAPTPVATAPTIAAQAPSIPTPMPVPVAAVAAAAAPNAIAVAPQVITPPPVAVPIAPAPAPRPQPAAAPAAKPAPVGGGAVPKKGFRETAWFKKGELEEEMAKRAAENTDPLAGPAQEVPVGDVDPATLTADDRARLSLKTGRTEAMPVVKAPAPAMRGGDRMSDEDMLAEVDSSKKWMVIAGVAVAALAVIGAVLYFLLSGSSPKPKVAVAAAAVPQVVANAPPKEEPKPDPKPSTPAAAPKSAADNIKLAEQALLDAKTADAVQFIVDAKAAGAKPKDLKKVDLQATRALQASAKNSAKKHDRDGEIGAWAGLVKLHPGDKAAKAHLGKLEKEKK